MFARLVSCVRSVRSKVAELCKSAAVKAGIIGGTVVAGASNAMAQTATPAAFAIEFPDGLDPVTIVTAIAAAGAIAVGAALGTGVVFGLVAKVTRMVMAKIRA